MSNETGTGSEGGGEQNWLSSVPEDIRGHEVFTGMEKAGDAYQKLIDLSENSKGMIKIPGSDAGDDEKSAHFKALGRPDEASGYTIGKPEGLPENYLYDSGLEKVVRDAGHAAGVSDSALKSVFNAAIKHGSDSNNLAIEALKKSDVEAETQLKTDWGADFTANSEKSNRALKKFGGEETTKFLADSGLDNHPVIKKIFHKVFEAIGEDTFASGTQVPDGKKTKLGADGRPMLSFPSMEKAAT